MLIGTDVKIPLVLSTVAAGFPSPADDFIDKKLDLNQLIIKHPVATFFVHAAGNSMIKAGINDGDLLVVDRSIKPDNEDIIIAVVDGEMTVKRLRQVGEAIYLVPENPDYKAIKISADTDFQVWGTVTYVISKKA
ncbi:translesion error-prone DNA polymerase V autoproteolytic subunit [Candidatus Dojkabacteria bacterium]|uniref:Translesion error-prone DNA polymerase V autoproteolytic subunit n=1 Tax=Candidatus Dojkabacteria bacterium TaxID=2099670 RepID=A0A955L648_9BACT|nr:translesion error-prone DNA polymerase V autoproteolytic subunit [Candidatus Dojkabacteria bacterium]